MTGVALRDDGDGSEGADVQDAGLFDLGQRLRCALDRDDTASGAKDVADAEKLEAVIEVARVVRAGKMACGKNTQKWGRWLTQYGWHEPRRHHPEGRGTRSAWDYCAIGEREEAYRSAWRECPTVYGALAIALAEGADTVDRKSASSRKKKKEELLPPDLGPVQAEVRAVLLGVLDDKKATSVACLAVEAVINVIAGPHADAVLDAQQDVVPHLDRDDLAIANGALIALLRDE